MKFIEERNMIIKTCLQLQKIQYFLGTWGNISIRIGDEVLLTPTRVVYDVMKPEDIVITDIYGNKLEGIHNPTSEKEVHCQIYQRREDVKAVIHAHTVNAMAVSVLEIQEVPCMVEEMSQLLGGSIFLTPTYISAEKHVELGKVTAEVLKDHNAVIMRNHGSVCCGRDMAEAKLVASVQEKACEIYLKSISTGIQIKNIPDVAVASERYRYLYKYGHENT